MHHRLCSIRLQIIAELLSQTKKHSFCVALLFALAALQPARELPSFPSCGLTLFSLTKTEQIVDYRIGFSNIFSN